MFSGERRSVCVTRKRTFLPAVICIALRSASQDCYIYWIGISFRAHAFSTDGVLLVVQSNFGLNNSLAVSVCLPDVPTIFAHSSFFEYTSIPICIFGGHIFVPFSGYFESMAGTTCCALEQHCQTKSIMFAEKPARLAGGLVKFWGHMISRYT